MRETINQYNKLKELIDIKAVEIFDVYITYFPQGGDTFITDISIQETGIYINWVVAIGYGCKDGSLLIPMDIFCGNWLKWVADQVNGEL